MKWYCIGDTDYGTIFMKKLKKSFNHFISTVESSSCFMGESGSAAFLHPTNSAIPEPTKPKTIDE